MSEPLALRPMEFIDNYFPVIDGVTETVHEYARHMENATVVCPAMENRYLQKHEFPYPVLTSVTARVPFSRYASAVPKIDQEGGARETEENHLTTRVDIGYALTRDQSRKWRFFINGSRRQTTS